MVKEGLSIDEIVRKIMGPDRPEGVKPFKANEIMAKLVVSKIVKKLQK
jgi:hypothetical protein